MNLRGFERGARAMFSFPNIGKILAIDAVLAPASLIAGCSPLYIAHVLAVLPLSFILLAGKLANLRRAYGLSPIFLAWGAASSWLVGYSPLMLLPPSLILTLPLRFFTRSMIKSALPPFTALLLITPSATLTQLAAAMLLTIISVGSVEALARWLDRRISEACGSGLELLEALIGYMLRGDKEGFEEELKRMGRRRCAPIFALDLLDSGGRPWGIVAIPHIHPGPYRDVGSGDLPHRLMTAAYREGLEIVVLHGASNHGEDLACSADVDRLAQLLLEGGGEVLSRGERLGLGLAEVEGFRALALCFEGGAAIVVAERINGGMEDIPLQLAEELGSRGVTLVDAHNSYDDGCPSPAPDSSLARSLLACSKAALEAARSQLRGGWRVSIASMQGRLDFEVGSAGISLLTLVNSQRFLLAVVDSNNVLKEFRDKLYASFPCRDEIMVATTDTHELSGAIAGETYRPLGTSLRLEEVLRIVGSLTEHALRSLKPLRYRFRRIDFEALFLEPKKLERLSEVAERGLKYAFALLSFYGLTFFLVPLLA